jgi:8-oxo-dGTP pyrophosphatase MutT (NUDIX family)
MQKYKVYINKECKIITDNWKRFCAQYTLIEAAGGLAYNLDNQLLMIFRNGRWDLPKGKLELGENIRECAIREVEEECGVNNLKIVRELQSTYHTYEINDQAILKRTYWFKMNTNYSNELVPQIKEGITKVEWVNEEDITTKLENSYGNIKELF